MTLELLSDDRAYLLAEEQQRYALGNPAAPLLTFNAADSAGCAWWADEPEGWAAPAVALPMDRRSEGHGGFAGRPTYEPRTLTLTGAVTAPSFTALRAARERLVSLYLSGSYVRYSQLDDGPAKGLWCLPSGELKWESFDGRFADFSLLLVAEDPIKTGASVTYGPIRLPSALGEGGYPMGAGGAVMPWTASGGGAGSLTVQQIANDGNEASHALYSVTGPVPRPRVQLGTGEYVALDDDLGALDTWVIDTAAGTSMVNGVNRYDAWAAGSTFPLIPGRRLDPSTGSELPGGTTAVLRSATGGSDPAAGLVVTTAPSWK